MEALKTISNIPCHYREANNITGSTCLGKVKNPAKYREAESYIRFNLLMGKVKYPVMYRSRD